jgi:vacuolar-type H+-ATPase subunit H
MRLFHATMPRGAYVDEKLVEDLKFHQDTVASDSNSPLHLIREKEIEISGRMFAAKREADEIVADARKRAAAILSAASDDATELASAHDQEVRARLETEKIEVRDKASAEVEELERRIKERQSQAVAFVVKSVMGD